MAKKKSRLQTTITFFSKTLFKDAADLDSDFKSLAPPLLKITSDGEIVGKERSEPRVPIRGIVFLHCPDNKIIKVIGRDLSQSGVGVIINKKLASYIVGSEIGLEFAQPHKLQGMMFKVELRRVHIDGEGHNQIGFRLIASNRFQKKRVKEYLTYMTSDPWA